MSVYIFDKERTSLCIGEAVPPKSAIAYVVLSHQHNNFPFSKLQCDTQIVSHSL